MKSLKKMTAILSIVLLLVVGCGKEQTPQEVFEEASKKFEDMDNVTIKMNVLVEAESEGETQSVSIDVNAKIDSKNKVNDMDIAMSMGGMSFTLKTYVEEKDGNIVTYTQNIFGSGYTKSTEPASDTDNLNFDELTDIFDSSKDAKKVDSDISGMDKYEVTISGENLEKIMDSASMITGDDQSYTIKDGLTVPVYINKDGYIAKMVIDMTNAIDLDDTDVTYNKMVVTMEFSDLNKTTVSIPDDVKNNAVEEDYDDYDDYDDYEDYVDDLSL